MSYCETCKGPHQPKRKIPASRLALAWYASRFIYERGAPGFLDAIRQMIPSAKDMSDQEIVTWVGDSTQCLRDLLDVFIDPETRLLRVSAAEFLVLRGATLGDGVPRITVSEEAPASVVVGFPGDDHGMAGAVWMVDRQSARDLAAVLREQLGEPDMDMAASAEGTEHMMEAFQENTVHTHKE